MKDDLAFARGIAAALLISVALWALIATVLAWAL
jgi:hypothetical protein